MCQVHTAVTSLRKGKVKNPTLRKSVGESSNVVLVRRGSTIEQIRIFTFLVVSYPGFYPESRWGTCWLFLQARCCDTAAAATAAVLRLLNEKRTSFPNKVHPYRPRPALYVFRRAQRPTFLKPGGDKRRTKTARTLFCAVFFSHIPLYIRR